MRLDDLQVFVQTVDAGSFSAAARQLDMTAALVSSSVQRLEGHLGSRLLVRSTRSMRLSPEGERFLPHARAALASLASGTQVLADPMATLTGTLHLSVPSDIGRNVLLPWLDDFQSAHPGLSLRLRVSDQPVDLVREPLHAAVRYGVLSDSSLVSLPLAPRNRRTLCASPAYLDRHGVPAAPQDLGQHNCLRYVLSDLTHDRWTFHMPGGVQTVAVKGDRVSDDADVVRRWAVAGRGLVYKSRLDVLDDLSAGRLVEVFPPDTGEPAPLQLVCAHRASVSPLLRLLSECLKRHCAAAVAKASVALMHRAAPAAR